MGISLSNVALQNRRDIESPYRRFVVTTELRSDPKLSKCALDYWLPAFGRWFVYGLTFLVSVGGAGGKRSFLKGGFTIVGVGAPAATQLAGCGSQPAGSSA